MTSWYGSQIHATIFWPWQVKSLMWWLLHKILHANVHSAKSKMIGSELFVVLNERLFSGERTALSSQIHHPPLSLLPPTPMGLLPLEYENTLSLNKSLPQLQFILVFFCYLLFSLAVTDETWTWNGIIGVINARWQGWHKQKPFVFIHRGSLRAASLYCFSN